jgi:hypothetical protein
VADPDESDLSMARRHIVEAELHIDAQRRLIAKLEEAGQPTELAEQLLTSLEDTLAQMRVHCDYLERAEHGD